MSEELDHSLQQAIETYINDRLRSIDEQLVLAGGGSIIDPIRMKPCV